ncbi:unnamed protein product [Rangifer tarandus platyrhynchus]|uniref:Uncharacterized protein n=1 Tax=Rangifer tarandus platyrhynchus TaxID=3082113 RepID=A0ACB1KHJ0_RANTA
MGGATGKESACQFRRRGFDPWVRNISWRRTWQPTPVLLPGESHVMSPNGHHQTLADTSIVTSYPFSLAMRNFKIGSLSNSSVYNTLIIRFDQPAVREFTLFCVLSSILTHRLCLHDTKSHLCLYYQQFILGSAHC